MIDTRNENENVDVCVTENENEPNNIVEEIVVQKKIDPANMRLYEKAMDQLKKFEEKRKAVPCKMFTFSHIFLFNHPDLCRRMHF